MFGVMLGGVSHFLYNTILWLVSNKTTLPFFSKIPEPSCTVCCPYYMYVTVQERFKIICMTLDFEHMLYFLRYAVMYSVQVSRTNSVQKRMNNFILWRRS